MEHFKTIKTIIVSSIVCLLFFTTTLQAVITNGHFDSNIEGWSYVGTSWFPLFGGVARFYESESGPNIFYLEQEISIEDNIQALSFDIFIKSFGSETDSFNVTLGGTNIYSWNSNDGPLNLDWPTITRPVSQVDKIKLRFEADFDQNEQIPFTTIMIDNVVLEIIPAPGACTLGMIGIALVGLFHKPRRA